jgi:hypothetical protein
MSDIIIITVITSLNLCLSSAIAWLIFNENRRRRQLLAKDRENFHSALSTLGERLQSLANAHREPTELPVSENKKPSPAEGREQVRLALQRLKMGQDPQEVCREMGYSRSEMGFLEASAKRDI